jgi:hypothetical protein
VRRLVLPAAVLLAVAFAAPASAQPLPPGPVDPRVFILGDSVILGAQGVLAGRLGLAGWQVTQVSAESFHTYNVAPYVDASRAGIGEVAIVALGANEGSTPDQFAVWIDQLMEHLREVPRVYWVNLRQFRDWAPAANDVIAAATTRWPNLRVIDWGARSTADPTLVYEDGLHLNGAGQVAMAELIGTTLDEYVKERTAEVAKVEKKFAPVRPPVRW